MKLTISYYKYSSQVMKTRMCVGAQQLDWAFWVIDALWSHYWQPWKMLIGLGGTA